MPSLPCLRKLSIRVAHSLDHSATMLCLSFLYYPEHCPLLEEIKMNGFPEWDVLVLMLERRNFRTDGTWRIGTVKLPVIPPVLREPLSLLLEGKYARRPSNEEISTEAFREVMCNGKVDVVPSRFYMTAFNKQQAWLYILYEEHATRVQGTSSCW